MSRVYWLGFALAVGCGSKESKSTGEAPKESAPAKLRVARISASSAQGPSVGYTFVATNLLDGAIETSWQPAKNDRGPHWVRLELDEEVTITSIAIANGFQIKDRYGDEFLLNRRIASGRLRFGDGAEVPVRFAADARGLVSFPIDRKRTRTVELFVDETHDGTKWKDLAVSEIQITGIAKRAEPTVAKASEPSARGEWWTPPAGERTDVPALAHGFAGIDENDLGAIFTSELKPVHGAPNLFESKPPRRVARDSMDHLVIKLRDSAQLEAGFRYLIFTAGSTHKAEREYQLVRALQVSEVLRVDESARMRRPPEEAVFYLAEVHRGRSFDLLVEGEHSAMGAQLGLVFGGGDASLKHLRESSRYRLKAFGLGLRDVTGDGIFAMSPQQIAERYRAGPAVPVQLVFRTIPGRVYKPKKLIAVDLDGDGTDELVEETELMRRGWIIGTVTVYAIRGKALETIGSVQSSYSDGAMKDDPKDATECSATWKIDGRMLVFVAKKTGGPEAKSCVRGTERYELRSGKLTKS